MAEENKKILDEIQRNYKLAVEDDGDNRRAAEDDIVYLDGQDQWEPRAKQIRMEGNRPALTFNLLPVFVQNVVNENRQNEIGFKVSATGNEDKETAQVIQGMLRHIEYASHAKTAYDIGTEAQVGSSLGAWRVDTEYVDPFFDTKEGGQDRPELFYQQIRIRPIFNPMSVYFDIFAQEPDRSDMEWCFVLSQLGKEPYKRKYPNSKLKDSSFFRDMAEAYPEWIKDDAVQVGEYWYYEYSGRRTLCLLDDGSTAWKDEIPKGELGRIQNERQVRGRKVKQCITNGIEVLEEKDWLGMHIPIIPIIGRELYVKGRRRRYSLIRFAKEAQNTLNYFQTALAEGASLLPRPKWIGAVGQFKTNHQQWVNANVVNEAFLQYDAINVDGQLAPAPKWEAFSMDVAQLLHAASNAHQMMKAIMNIYDASLGERAGSQESGVAIQRRQVESAIANYHFFDNRARSQWHTGRIILDLIPKIYDTARQVQIMGEDDAEKVILVNQEYVEMEGQKVPLDQLQLDPIQIEALKKQGRIKSHILDAGKYDVTLSISPSYENKRQEAFDLLSQFSKAYPPLMQIAGDIIFRNSDIPGGDEIANRLRKTIDPKLLEDESGEVPLEVLKQQLQQAMEQNQVLQNAVNEMQEAIQTKRAELESKERIAAADREVELIKIETDANIEMAKLDQAEGIAKLESNLAILEQVMAVNRANQEMIQNQIQQREAQAHEMGMAAMGAENESVARQEEADIQSQQAQQAQQGELEMKQFEVDNRPVEPKPKPSRNQ